MASVRYAGAKRTQIFIADYSQKESDRLELGLRFTAPTASDVAAAVIQLATNPDHSKGEMFVVSGKGLQATA